MSIPETIPQKSISNFVSEKVAIACCFSNMTQSISFLHSPTDLAGGILFPTSRVVALSGFRHTAYPVIIQNTSISATKDQRVPNLDSLIQMESIADIVGLSSADDTDNELLSTHPFILIPPFLWSTAMDLRDRSPANVLLAFLERTKSFFEENESQLSFTLIEFQQSCKRLYQFLWLAKQLEMPPLIFRPPEDDIDVFNWSKFRHAECIEKDPNHHSAIYGPRIAQPAATVIQQPPQQNIDIQNSLNQLAKLAPGSDKKKGFEKLHPSTQNMILQASSSNGQTIAASPCTECSDFYKSSSHGEAKLTFLKSMLHNWNCNVSVTSGVIINLFNGNFSREYEEAPSNFSPFSFPKRPFMSGSSDKESLSLQLKELLGDGLSKEDIKGALSQDLVIPRQVEYMKHNIKNTIGASCIFFSNKSILSQNLAAVAEHVERNLNIYEAAQYQNKYFCTEFLYALDTRIQLWLLHCEAACDREEVNDNLIDFSDDMNKVLLRNFSYMLPQSLKSKFEDNSSEETIPSPNPPKKRRKSSFDDKEESRMVSNNSTLECWIIPEDKYNSKVRHNASAIRKRPKLNGKFMCHRWHSKGYCFVDCNNKDSHIPSDSISDPVKGEYTKWVASTVEGN